MNSGPVKHDKVTPLPCIFHYVHDENLFCGFNSAHKLVLMNFMIELYGPVIKPHDPTIIIHGLTNTIHDSITVCSVTHMHIDVSWSK